MVNDTSILAVVWCYLHNELVSGSIIHVFIGILYSLFAHWKIQKDLRNLVNLILLVFAMVWV